MTRTRVVTILCALMLTALGLRLWGLEFAVPCWRESDPHVAQHVEVLRRGPQEGDKAGRNVQYPYVLPWLSLLQPTLREDPAQVVTVAQHLRQASFAFFEVRRAVALLSILLIPLTYLLARRFLAAPWALLAAAMIAVSLLHHNFAQQARPHALAVVLYTLAMLSYLRLARTPTWGSYLLAGTATALSIGVLHSGVAVVLPCAAAHLLRDERPRRLFTWKAWLLPLFALAAFPIFYPFFFEGTSFGQLKDVGGSGFSFADHEIELEAFRGGGFWIVLRTFLSFEPGVLAVVALALLALCFRRARAGDAAPEASASAARRELWIALAFVAPYLLAIGLFDRTYERFVLPLLPYATVFGAWGLRRLSQSSLPRLVVRAAVALALLGFGVQAFACAKLSYLRALPSTTDLAAEFLAAQPGIREQTIYVWPYFDLPLARIAKDPTRKRRIGGTPTTWSEYLWHLSDEQVPEPRYDVRFFVKRDNDGWSADKIARDLAGFVHVLGPGWYVVSRSRDPAGDATDSVPDAMRELGRVRFEARPNQAGDAARYALHFQDEMLDSVPNWTLRLFSARRVGPVLEIIRVE